MQRYCYVLTRPISWVKLILNSCSLDICHRSEPINGVGSGFGENSSQCLVVRHRSCWEMDTNYKSRLLDIYDGKTSNYVERKVELPFFT